MQKAILAIEKVGHIC
jgi:hypothetical protein